MVAFVADVEQGEEVGCLTGGGEHGSGAAFHFADLGGHGVVRGVLQARVEIPRLGKVEESAHLLARRVFERRRLDDRRCARFAVVRLVAALHADGVNMFAHESSVSSTVGRPSAGGVDVCVWLLHHTQTWRRRACPYSAAGRVNPSRCCNGRRARVARRCRRLRSSRTKGRSARWSSTCRGPRRSTGRRSCW